MSGKWSFEFRILIKKEDDLWIAHCLELDLVATSQSEDQVQEDIVNVIAAQVRYCLVHDNMDYLFRRAPQDVWDEYNACAKQAKPKLLERQEESVVKGPTKNAIPEKIAPYSFTANTCRSSATCHAA